MQIYNVSDTHQHWIPLIQTLHMKDDEQIYNKQVLLWHELSV